MCAGNRPGRGWHRNLYAGSVIGVPAVGEELPRLPYALGKGDRGLWKEQTAVYRAALTRLVEETRSVRGMLER